jgi:hypothetical protein
LYALPIIIRVIKSRGMMGEHVACMEEARNAYTILVRKPEGETPLKDLGVEGKIIFERVLEK